MDLVWQTTAENRKSTVSALESSGAEVRERRGFEPVTAIAAVAGVIAVSRAIGKVFRDLTQHGVVIDMTRSPVEIRDMPGWSRNQVLVIAAEGPTFHEFSNADDLAALLKAAGGK